MTDKQLASIAQFWHNLAQESKQIQDSRRAVIGSAYDDITALLAEVKRIQAIDEQQNESISQLMDEQTRYVSENARLKATLRDFARRVTDANNMSEWNVAGLADTARAILGEV